MPKDTCSEAKLSEYAVTGCKILDEYLEALNTGDAHRWAKTPHYPHVRIAGDTIRVWDSPEAFAKDNDLTRLVEKINWGYNKWDWRELVQFGPSKMHYLVQFSRYTVNDALISYFESLYIITRIGARWAVQGRSSYAGVFAENAGY
jgi:hypothetical protein